VHQPGVSHALVSASAEPLVPRTGDIAHTSSLGNVLSDIAGSFFPASFFFLSSFYRSYIQPFISLFTGPQIHRLTVVEPVLTRSCSPL
jgi:hypothetical protein